MPVDDGALRPSLRAVSGTEVADAAAERSIGCFEAAFSSPLLSEA
jgi:hypothetical protein